MTDLSGAETVRRDNRVVVYVRGALDLTGLIEHFNIVSGGLPDGVD